MTRPVKLAVFLDQEISAGGGYQQALNAATLVQSLPDNICDPVVITNRRSNIKAMQKYGIQVLFLSLSLPQKALIKLRSRIKNKRLLEIIRRVLGDNAFDRFLSKHHIDLIYFTSPSLYAGDTERYPYIFTVWDLCHRDNVEFPEVRQDREFERRELRYRQLIPKAVATFVDSELGLENLVRRYGVDRERIYVMPFLPARSVELNDDEYKRQYVDVKKKYALEFDYVFYPAQFWPHKNHIYLLHGLKSLEEEYGIEIGVIFAGGDAGGNRGYIENMVAKLGLVERVRFAGFVENEEIPYLYRQSVALVMPTYFGPTNLPPLEAFRLGVPVLYSDLPGLREQVGDAALLLDLGDPKSMAKGLSTLLSQTGIRELMVERGRRQLLTQDSDKDRFVILIEIIDRFRYMMDRWAKE